MSANRQLTKGWPSGFLTENHHYGNGTELPSVGCRSTELEHVGCPTADQRFPVAKHITVSGIELNSVGCRSIEVYLSVNRQLTDRARPPSSSQNSSSSSYTPLPISLPFLLGQIPAFPLSLHALLGAISIPIPTTNTSIPFTTHSTILPSICKTFKQDRITWIEWEPSNKLLAYAFQLKQNFKPYHITETSYCATKISEWTKTLKIKCSNMTCIKKS